MATSAYRYDRLLEEIPKHNGNITKAALAAGFSKSTAEKQQKILLNHALKHRARRDIEERGYKQGREGLMPSKEVKERLKSYELVGLTREQVAKRLKDIAMNPRDLATALKVMRVFARDIGIELDDDAPRTTVPVLNVTVKENTKENRQENSPENSPNNIGFQSQPIELEKPPEMQ